jgi:hypothetical protein
VIVDYAANCMKCEIIGLAGSTVPNPIQLTTFSNVSDMSERRILYETGQPRIKADAFTIYT